MDNLIVLIHALSSFIFLFYLSAIDKENEINEKRVSFPSKKLKDINLSERFRFLTSLHFYPTSLFTVLASLCPWTLSG